MLDEPLSALDTGLREHLLGVLDATLQATGTPALYVTHDQDEAFAIADRVAVLAGGRLLQVDDPDDAVAAPGGRRRWPTSSATGSSSTRPRPRPSAGRGRLRARSPSVRTAWWPTPPARRCPCWASGRVAAAPSSASTSPAGASGGCGRANSPTHADRRTRLAVRLDPAGCVVLPTGSALDSARNCPRERAARAEARRGCGQCAVGEPSGAQRPAQPTGPRGRRPGRRRGWPGAPGSSWSASPAPCPDPCGRRRRLRCRAP